MDKNTQQPVAAPHITDAMIDAIQQVRLIDWCCDKDGSPTTVSECSARAIAEAVLTSATPVPRDVLMAFGETVREQTLETAWQIGKGKLRSAVDLAAIADRYASQVPPERESITPQQLADLLAAGGYAQLDKRANQPEPVNQQMLAALKGYDNIVRIVLNGLQRDYEERGLMIRKEFHDELKNAHIAACEAVNAARELRAIAAAEKEQGHD